MRNIQRVLFTALAVLGLANSARAATITVGSYDLLPNTPNQLIPLYVTGIVPNAGNTEAPGNVNIMALSVAIAGGGPVYGGTLGPALTTVDLDSGPSIWVAPNSPAGRQPAIYFFDGITTQFVYAGALTVSGFVNVSSGVLATLVVDTTGFLSGEWTLKISGGRVFDELLGDTELFGPTTVVPVNFVYQAYGGTAGRIAIVPEPSSVVLAAIGLIVLAAWGWPRRKR